MSMVNIKGLDKAEVLLALYNASYCQIIMQGVSKYTLADARIDLENSREKYFDYLHGRLLQVDLRDDNEFDDRLYDRALGYGEAEKAINELKKRKGLFLK